jgi:hypothetical protein
MKNISLILAGILFAASGLFSAGQEHNREADPDYKLQRQKWIEGMNRAEPGVDYKLLNEEARRNIYLKNRDFINQLKKRDEFSPEMLLQTSISNGFISGRWIERGSNNQSGRMHVCDVDFENNMIIAGSSGGNIWRGTLDGENWICLNNGVQFNNISGVRLIDKSGTKRIGVFYDKGFAFSDDFGNTWYFANGLENLKAWGGLIRGAVNQARPNEVYLVNLEWNFETSRKEKRLHYSNDFGANFELVETFSDDNTVDLWTSEVAAGSVYFLLNDEIYMLSGKRIEMVCTVEFMGEASNYRTISFRGAVAGGKTNFGVFGRLNSGDRYIYYSLDGGLTWDITPPVPENLFFRTNSFALSNSEPGFIWAGGVNLYHIKKDQASWNMVNSWGEYYQDPENKLHADIPGVNSFFDPNGNEIYFISTDGGLYRTYPNDISVKNISLEGLNVSQYYDVLSSETNHDYLFAGSQDQGFQQSEGLKDEIYNFDQIISGDYGHLTSSDDLNSLWSVYPGFVQYHYNTKSNIQRLVWSFPDGTSGDRVWIPPVVAFPDNPQKALIAPGSAGGGSNIYELTAEQGGITPVKTDFQFDIVTDNNDVTTLAISPINPDKIYAGTRLGKFYYSTDGGNTWNETLQFEGPGIHYLYGAKILPSKHDENLVYLAGSGYSNPGVFKSSDGGKTFEPMNKNLPKTMIYDIDISNDGRVIFAATALGPYVWTRDGDHWISCASPATPQQTYWSVQYLENAGIARFGTYGRGIWDLQITNFDFSANSVNEPGEFDFGLNVYPNPSSDLLNIEIDNKNAGYCSIAIFDMESKRVASIYEDYLTHGAFEFTWDLTASGAELPAGMYFLVVSVDGISRYQKIVKQ